MFEEIRNIKTGKKDLRSFGITIGFILLAIAAFLFFKDKDSYQTFLYISGALIIFGLIIPVILKPIYLAWMTFAVILGWFMTRVILSLLFFIILTPLGLILRIVGKDFLNQKEQKELNSFWNKRNSKNEKNQNYEKQF